MTDTTNDKHTGELLVTRDIAAPRELVFRAMLAPEHLTHFWGPTGTHTPVDTIVIEPWAGGRFETTIVPEGASVDEGFPMKAVFVEIVEPERIVFRELEMDLLSTSTFTDLGDGRTRVVVHQTNVAAEYLNDESREGFESSIDRFEAYIATLAT